MLATECVWFYLSSLGLRFLFTNPLFVQFLSFYRLCTTSFPVCPSYLRLSFSSLLVRFLTAYRPFGVETLLLCPQCEKKQPRTSPFAGKKFWLEDCGFLVNEMGLGLGFSKIRDGEE